MSQSTQKQRAVSKIGALAWMAKNSVAANILMICLLLGGIIQSCSVKREVFPEFNLDRIIINVPYPGASPEEVEQGVILAVEEAIRGVDDVKEFRSTASEGFAVTVVELLVGAQVDQALRDIQAGIDRITSFPKDVERPVVFNVRNRNPVISLVVFGQQTATVLKALAEDIRSKLLQHPDITVVELSGVRPLEISIEVSQANLRKYNLTLEGIAEIIRQSSLDVPAGGVKTAGGEVLVRVAERRERGSEFDDIVLVSRPDGTKIRVGDIAESNDDFADTDLFASYNGEPAAKVDIFRVGDQQPLVLSKIVHDYVEQHKDALPPGVKIASWMDWSEMYEQRVNLLWRNATLGLILVLIILGLFLEIRLAFWVTLGIPISFIGALLVLPATDMSINMISLFAFIVVLGMVVDDAIIVGESIYKHRQEGMSAVDAAILGVKEVAVPVTFAIITTIMAYMPMLFIPGIMGKFFRVIPIVVITVLMMSLIESLLILPAHLAEAGKPKSRRLFGRLHEFQMRFSRFLEQVVIAKWYRRLITLAVTRRYVTITVCLATFFVTIGLVAGGRVDFYQFPKVEGDIMTAHAELPFGTSVVRSKQLQTRMIQAAKEILEQHGGEARISRGIYSHVGDGSMVRMSDPGAAGMQTTGSHFVEVSIYLVPIGKRQITTSEFARQWRAKLNDVAGIEKLIFQYSTGPTAGAAISLELSHPDQKRLHEAASVLAQRLADFQGVHDIDDGYAEGKEQLDITLTDSARSLNVTQLDLARQVRASFFGAEAAKQQRGRDEIRVYVRLPKEERASEYNVEELVVRTPQGGEIPFSEAAVHERGRSDTQIRRIDGRRAVTVTADVDQEESNAQKIMARLEASVIPDIQAAYPGLSYSIGGEQKSANETNSSLAGGFLMALIGMIALLAIAFRSYVQPFIIMIAIPFGLVGAVWGHVIMGYGLSLMSMMGAVALSGVVVNDSLILVVSVNRLREQGKSAFDAVVSGSQRRFRPIILTSLTTFFGLCPMILETSVQARFLIPMAISLAFGVMFATVVTLILIPCVYIVIEDMKQAVAWLGAKANSDPR